MKEWLLVMSPVDFSVAMSVALIWAGAVIAFLWWHFR
jgi:hypothetical protein